MTHVRMRLPAHATSIALDGTEYLPDTDGCVLLERIHEATAQRHGLVRVALTDKNGGQPDAPKARSKGKARGDAPAEGAEG